MKVVFESEELEFIFVEGKEKGKPKYPPEVIKGFIKRVGIMLTVNNTAELRQFKGLRLESLAGDYAGFHSIRINDKYRIILKIHHEDDGDFTIEVIHLYEITDYH